LDDLAGPDIGLFVIDRCEFEGHDFDGWNSSGGVQQVVGVYGCLEDFDDEYVLNVSDEGESSEDLL